MRISVLLIGFTTLIAATFAPHPTEASSYSLYRAATVSGPDTVTLSQGLFGREDTYVCSVTDFTCRPATTSPTAASDLPTLPDQSRSFTDPSGQRSIIETTTTTAAGRTTAYTLFVKTATGWDAGTLMPTPPFPIGRVIFDGAGKSFVYRSEDVTEGTFTAHHFDQATRRVSEFDIDADALYLTLNHDGTKFAYYRPAVTNTTTEKEMVLWQKTASGMTDTRFRYAVEQPWELNLDANRLLTFSPTGGTLVFIADEAGFQHPYVLKSTQPDIASSTPLSWPDLNTVADVLLASDDVLYLIANSKSAPYEWSLYRHIISEQTTTVLAKNVSIMYPLERVNDDILFAQMDGPNMRPTILRTDTGTIHPFSGLTTVKSPYRLTNSVQQFKNGGFGVLLRKDKVLNQSKQPLIVWLHGGPYRQASVGYHSYPGYATYDWLLEELAQAGATILKLDYPGSYGYGNEYTYSLLNNNGLADTKAIMEAIEETVASENIDGPVYVMGNSYGGYLAPKLMTEYPELITGAIAINGVYEWRTLLKYLRTSIFNVHFSGVYDPLENTERYEQASIARNLDELTPNNKMLLVTGTADATINTDQAYTFAELLTLMKKDVTHILIPGEDHVLKQKSSNELLCRSAFSFVTLPTFSDYCTL